MRVGIIWFALGGLARRWRRNVALGGLLALIVFALTSVLLVNGALERALGDTLDALPDLTVQRVAGGRLVPTPMDRLWDISRLPGVTAASERRWGYVRYAPTGHTFTVVGFDPYLGSHRAALTEAVEALPPEALEREDIAIAGPAVRRALGEVFYRADRIALPTPRGEELALDIVATLDVGAELSAGDTLLVPHPTAAKLLGLEDETATDLVLTVPNPDERPTVAGKIAARYPDARVLTRADLSRSYATVFDLSGGVLLGAGALLLLAFFVLAFERAAAATGPELRESATLRAVGWSVADTVAVRLWESGAVAIAAATLGSAAAALYAFAADAPGLLALLSGWDPLGPLETVPPLLSPAALLLPATVAIVAYVGAAVIPAWRMAALDPEEVLR